jgi:hypothetical protein
MGSRPIASASKRKRQTATALSIVEGTFRGATEFRLFAQCVDDKAIDFSSVELRIASHHLADEEPQQAGFA